MDTGPSLPDTVTSSVEGVHGSSPNRGAAAEGATQPNRTGDCGDLPAVLRDHVRYHILEKLGEGGMGAVYLAEHKLMHRRVALKVIRAELAAQPHLIQRFQREVQAAARLAHPNIVTAYDAEQAGSCHFLVMEYVEGTDLARLVKEQGRLSIREACDCARQAALGLQHAHEHQLIHRDLKPQNLMRTAEGQVKILDFGLARAVRSAGEDGGDCTASGVLLGTPDYIAPEQVDDAGSVDIRADIYSLGCTLYYLLGGRVPFPGRGTLGKLAGHAQEQPTSLLELRPELPAELVQVVARMMAKMPAARYQTPGEVTAALAPWCQEQPETVGLPPAPGASRRGARRHGEPEGSPLLRSRRAVLIGVATAIIAALGGILFWPRGGTDEPTDMPDQVKNAPAAKPRDTSSKAAFLPALEQGRWARLFNGKDLTGWRPVPTRPQVKWQVDGGVLIVNSGVDLLYFTPRTYENFLLRAEVKVKKGSGNLVFRMTSPRYDAGYGFGLAHTAGGPVAGTLNLFRKAPPTMLASGKHRFDPDQWCKLAVVAEGHRLRTFVDDELDNEVVDLTYSSGYVGLRLGQVDNEAHFRNVEIHELKPAASE